MNIESFKKEITKGTGKAYLLLRKNSHYCSDKLEDIIFSVSIDNTAYDPQCEDTRAEYLFSIIELYRDKEKIVNRLVKYFSRMRKDDWGSEQMFQLIKLFIDNGTIKNKEIIYKRVGWYLNNYKSDETSGVLTLVALDGIEGFMYIAEKLGTLLENNEDVSINYWILRESSDIVKKDCLSIVKSKSKQNHYLKKYLLAIKESKKDDDRLIKKRPLISSKTLVRKLKTSNSYPFYWGKRASKKELLNFAKSFIKFTNEKHIERGLRIFTVVKFPLGYKKLMSYLEKNNEMIRKYTLESLALFKNKTVHQIGLDNLTKKTNVYSALSIFIKNFEESDLNKFCDILSNSKNEYEFHDYALAMKKIFLKNKTNKAKKLLDLIHNRLTCGICRFSILKAMNNCNVLNQEKFNEMEFDSYDEIKKYHKKLKRKFVAN